METIPHQYEYLFKKSQYFPIYMPFCTFPSSLCPRFWRRAYSRTYLDSFNSSDRPCLENTELDVHMSQYWKWAFKMDSSSIFIEKLTANPKRSLTSINSCTAWFHPQTTMNGFQGQIPIHWMQNQHPLYLQRSMSTNLGALDADPILHTGQRVECHIFLLHGHYNSDICMLSARKPLRAKNKILIYFT